MQERSMTSSISARAAERCSPRPSGTIESSASMVFLLTSHSLQLLRQLPPRAAAVRDTVLLLGSHLRISGYESLRHEDRVPAESGGTTGRRRDRALGDAACGDDARSVEGRDRAHGSRPPVGERVEHPSDGVEPRALFQPLHESAGESSPRVDFETRVLDEDGPAQPVEGRANLDPGDLGGIERLRLGQIEVEPLERETHALGLLRLLGAAGDEDEAVGKKRAQRVDCFCRRGASSTSGASLEPSSLYTGTWFETPFKEKNPIWATSNWSFVAS